MNRKSILSTLPVALAACVLVVFPGVAPALDTDVYLKAPGVSRDDSPNVLIILDNSGSMDTTITSADPYDPTIAYADAGYGSNRVYWSTTASVPGTTSTRWFPTTDNNCTTSQFNLGSTAGATGFYASDNVVGWIWDVAKNGTTSTGKGHWGDLTRGTNSDGASRMGIVDCGQDNPADASGTYLTKGTSGVLIGNAYTNTATQKLDVTAFQKPTLYSSNYLNWRANPPGATATTRIELAREAVKTIIDANKGVRFGLMVFNQNNSLPDGGRVIAQIDTMTDARRTWMKGVVDTINAETYTPLSETLWEAYRYLAGQGVAFGNPTPAETPNRDVCAQDPACTTATGTYVSPFTIACQKAYVILVTDGDPTNDTAANTFVSGLPGIGTISGNPLDELAGWMYTHDVYGGLGGNQTVVTFTVGFDTGISASGLQLLQDTATKGGGKYYTAASGTELANALQGAITDALQVTTSFTAPALSVNAFNTLFNRDEVYFSVFKPSSTQRWNGNVKKYSLCKDKSATPSCKFGEIIDANNQPAVDITTLRIKDTARSYWSSSTDGSAVDKGGAGSKLETYANRNVYTYTGTFNANKITPTGGVTSLSGSTHAVSDANTALTEAMLGVSTPAERTELINWIRGQDVFDEDTDGVTAEDRNWRFYDPIHSRPVIVNYGGTSAAPIMKLFVGTNDGVVRMVNENTGIEEWAFVAPDLLPNLAQVAANADGNHIWGLDSTPSFDVQDKSKDSSNNVVNLADGIIDPSIGDYVHMYVGMRRGGNNIYAFDITPSSTLTSATATGGVQPKLMWVIQGGTSTGYAALGQTWSQPVVRRIRMGTGGGTGTNAESATTKVLLFGGGYDPTNDTNIPAGVVTRSNAIFIANPLTGERIWWASGTNSGADLELAGMDYSIASELRVMDANADGAGDRIYVGDVGGQVWRIDLSPTLKLNTNADSNGHVFADLACTSGTRPSCAGTPMQDRRRFFYPPNVTQVEDSTYSSATPKYDIVTIASGDREDPLDFLTLNLVPSQGPVHNRIYALRDYQISTLSTGGTITYPATIKDADLFDATSNSLQGATTTTVSASAIQSSEGWYLNLVDSSGGWVGEKSLAKTDIFAGTLYATTFTPANASTGQVTCSANEGLGTLYALNVLYGGANVDLNKDGVIDASDRLGSAGGGIPSEHVIVIREGGLTDLVGTNTPGAVPPELPPEDVYWFQ